MRDERVRQRLEVRGVVQGVGFRPFVYVTASALSLSGSVANNTGGVVIEVEGDSGAVRQFVVRLREQAPPLAVVESIRSVDLPVIGGTGFTIAESQQHGGVHTLVSADVASCADCRREVADPGDRRYRHPFITCTNCGPRFSIITGLPYDRPATTMADFVMCPACEREYHDPSDRRFHAQPIACHDCGPRLSLVLPGQDRPRAGEQALAGARALLAAGRILAVKGLGGYHLACDAGNWAAVARLRRRKGRVSKPFAVMVRDLETAAELVELAPGAAELLAGPRAPIVLLPRRHRGTAVWQEPERVAGEVAPGNADLGVMLPYTPLHRLLFGLPGDPPGPDVLVMTSGNLAGEPIVTDDTQALDRLAPLVDGWLRHDRPIQVPADDSVVRIVDGQALPIRRSRGYAPLPVALPFAVPPTLAVGADLKNTFALARGRYAWLSQHLGEMDDVATLEAFGAAERHLELLTGVRPVQLAADRHPGYRSADWARRHAAGRPVLTVQHHHAHVAAVMAEHGQDGARPVIGVAFDGTGYGDDGAVWGGEVLLADYKGFHRLGHLRYVPLPGGDAAIERPYRMALAHLAAAKVDWDPALPPVAACPPTELAVLQHQLTTGFGCVPTSSMGRLFDAVAALIGLRQVVDFEAQAAIELEACSRSWTGDAAHGYRFAVSSQEDGMLIADPAPVLRAIVADLRAAVAIGLIGGRFHEAVVALVVHLALAARDQGAGSTVALSGGVFQNGRLLSGTRQALQEVGFVVLCHRQVPPNDGGLALGQIVVAAAG